MIRQFRTRQFRSVPLALGVLASLVFLPAPPVGAQDSSLWRQVAPSTVESVTLTSIGTVLLLGGEGGVTAVDPLTGSTVWSREEIVRHAFADRASSALATLRGGGYAIVDLETGRDRWTSKALPFTKIQQWQLIDGNSALLVVGATSAGPHTLICVDLVSGEMRWRSDDLFRGSSSLESHAGGIHYNEFAEFGRALFLDASYGGLIKLDLDSGKLIWRASDAVLKPTRPLSTGEAPMLAADGRVFVASGNKVAVIDAASGRPIAVSKKGFRTPVFQMASTEKGLLVRGAYTLRGAMATHAWKSYLALIDPATGNSIWSTEGRRPSLDVRSAFVVRGAVVLVALEKGIAELDLATGAVLRQASLAPFKDGDGPTAIEPIGDNRFLVTSPETTRLVDWAGKVYFDRYHKAPGMGMFAKLGMAAAYGMAGYAVKPMLASALVSVFSQQRRAADSDRFRYVLGETTDKSALFKIDRTTGDEVDRIEFSERRPTYAFDPDTGIVVSANDRMVAGLRFAPAR